MFGFSLCLYSLSCCRFLFRLILNRKLFWEFRVFSAPLRKRSIFLLFASLLFLLFWINYRKRKQKRKSRILVCFCPKTSVFDANNILIFSVLYLYRANHTPTPPFLALAEWVSSLPKIFYFFIFYFFVKYSDFSNSAFLPNFEHFPKHHIYF